jgi:hypothetical protein
MLDLSHIVQIVRSHVVQGSRLHREALAALHARRFHAAEHLFESAAERYRRDLEVEALARLRVHQLMARVLAAGDGGTRMDSALEVERKLCLLETIESLEPPFDRIDAHTLLATWCQPAIGEGEAEPAGSLSVA